MLIGPGDDADNNVDGAEGTIPYIFLDFYRFFLEWESSSRDSGSGVYSFEECIVFVQF